MTFTIPTEPYPCRCGNCSKDYDLSIQFAICPHENRSDGKGCDSLPSFHVDKPSITLAEATRKARGGAAPTKIKGFA